MYREINKRLTRMLNDPRTDWIAWTELKIRYIERAKEKK